MASAAQKAEMRLRKKLREIEKIEARIATGERVDPLQFKKVQNKSAVLADLADAKTAAPALFESEVSGTHCAGTDVPGPGCVQHSNRYTTARLRDGPRPFVDHSPRANSELSGPSQAKLPSPSSLSSAPKVPDDAVSNVSTDLVSNMGDDASLDEFELSQPCHATARALVLIDWDDTLFPTTWVQRNDLLDESPTLDQVAQLGRLSELVRGTLLAAIHCSGKVVVVTNADAGWVEDCVSELMPALEPLVARIEVISARSLHEHTARCPYEWKRLTFKDLCEDFYGQEEHRNIVCIGDSMHEHEALAQVVSDMPKTISKSVKFAVRPELRLLTRQHELLAASLSKIVRSDKSEYVCLDACGE